MKKVDAALYPINNNLVEELKEEPQLRRHAIRR
jgi:hypothetical protein